MKIRLTNTDRKAFTKILAERLGVKAEYQGVPTFAYKVGSYTVCKDNTLEVEDGMVDKEVLRELTERGLIDGSWDEETDMLSVSLPLNDHNGRTLTNLIKILACRQEIINHAIGFDGFEISEELIRVLAEEKPETTDEFIDILNRDDVGEIRGFAIEDDKLHLQGFPLSDNPDKVKAYVNLASMMNEMAIKQKRVNIEKPDLTNEKYAFRIWLLRLGMVGEEYKTDRKILLEKLSGNGAFKTSEQKKAFYEKLKEKREAGKNAKEVDA